MGAKPKRKYETREQVRKHRKCVGTDEPIAHEMDTAE
jgi:hypothetical protein